MIIQNKKKISNFSEIHYIEGTSDSNGNIDTSQITLPSTPGYENILISIMYLEPNLNIYVPCMINRNNSGGIHLITGGASDDTSILVGQNESYTCPNATWRAYYIQQEVL